MAVEMGLRSKATGEYRVVPVATLRSFREVWLPFCERLGQVWIPLFAGGALTTVPSHVIPDVIHELQTLRAEAMTAPDVAWIAESIEAILATFSETNPAEWEYDFG